MADPLLRGESTPSRMRWGIALCALIGALAAVLVWKGNPGNMGICGACFLRDIAGAFNLHSAKPAVFRPEVAGVILGAFAWVAARGRFEGRTSGLPWMRIVYGAWMGVGALVFLGCPFRMLQRLGGGDGTALAGAAGLVAGVGLGTLLEKRGFAVRKTASTRAAVGLLGPAVALALVGAFLAGWMPRGAPEGMARAPWAVALGIALLAGALLSATGFCAISACRQVFSPGKGMLVAALALIAGYAAAALATGKFKAGFEAQPAAHGDVVASLLAMALVGIAGVLAGGCPVRQMVMAGEGNADALLTVAGITIGGVAAHAANAASSPAGPTPNGWWAVGIGLAFVIAGGALSARSSRG